MKRRHGLSYLPEYRIWQAMVQRCTNPAHQAYPNYGGRGITVCAQWLDSPAQFIEDMGRRPSARHEIDRKDNDKGYEPGNCRWTTRKVNARNRRSSRMVVLNGQSRPLVEWCEVFGIPADTAKMRLDAGWTPEAVFKTALRAKAANGTRDAKQAQWRATRKLPPGVKAKRGRFIARIRVGGKERFLGSFEAVEAAAEAYRTAKGAS